MRVAFAIIAFLGAASVGALPSTKLIVGGVPATHGEFPNIVQILYNGDHYCGGTLLNSGWILTAAHCALAPIEGYTVVAGEYRVGHDDGSEQIRTVSKIVNHEGFNFMNVQHDIAVMKLSQNVTYGTFVEDVKLATSSPVIPSDVTVAGWGRLFETDTSTSSVLMKVTVPMVLKQTCEAAYGVDRILDGMICAGIGGKDSCQGDSGGPLYNQDGEQVGIVSWGEGCARPGFPGVYTDVAKYGAWIFWNTLP